MRLPISKLLIAALALLIGFIDVCLIRNAPAGVRHVSELVLGLGIQACAFVALYILSQSRMDRSTARRNFGIGVIALFGLLVISPDIVAGACYNVGDDKLANGENRRRARENCCLIRLPDRSNL